MVKWHFALILASLITVGCSGFKEFAYRHSQMERAEDAWKAAGPVGAGPDYKDGWQTGYYDLAMGSDGQVPPVPPEKYWHDKYQNPVGQQRVADWYAGYQDGVIAAEHVGEYEWQLVPSSGVAALPTATVIDYPTFYGSPPIGEQSLPEPQPTDPPATSEQLQPAHAPRPSNDAVAAAPQPAPDLRTLTGRPAPSDVASLPEQQTVPASPTSRRVFERVPQPARDLPVPNAIVKEQTVKEWPAPVVAPSPATSTVQNSATNRTPPVVSAQPLVNPLATLEAEEIRPLFADRSPEAIADNSRTRRDEVVSRPTPTGPSRRATSLGAPVVTPTPLFAFRQSEDGGDAIIRSMTVPPRATIAEPGIAVTQSIPQPEFSSDFPSDDHWVVPREPRVGRSIASLPTPKIAEIVKAPTARTIDKSTKESLKSVRIQSAPAPAAADTSASNVVSTPRRPDTNTTQPAAPTHGPIVVAAQPIQIPAQLAANLPPAQTVDSPNSEPAGLAADTVVKDASNRWRSIVSEQIGDPNKVPKSPASGQSGLAESVVKMAEPFPLKSSDAQAKPIVVVARPLRLSEASSTTR